MYCIGMGNHEQAIIPAEIKKIEDTTKKKTKTTKKKSTKKKTTNKKKNR